MIPIGAFSYTVSHLTAQWHHSVRKPKLTHTEWPRGEDLTLIRRADVQPALSFSSSPLFQLQLLQLHERLWAYTVKPRPSPIPDRSLDIGLKVKAVDHRTNRTLHPWRLTISFVSWSVNELLNSSIKFYYCSNPINNCHHFQWPTVCWICQQCAAIMVTWHLIFFSKTKDIKEAALDTLCNTDYII